MKEILFSWSGGKDSSMALYYLLRESTYRISSLMTNLTEGYDRISMHGVRVELLEMQAEALGFSLYKIYTSQKSSNEEYEQAMGETFLHFQGKGITTVAYGDIFLEDLKLYREKLLEKSGFSGIYPIWKRPTSSLARKFIESGFKAVVICVKSELLDKSFAGRPYNEEFLRDLPDNVDPCGENGEFHSFVFEGPIFRKPLAVKTGKVVTRGPFHYCDLLPA